MAAFCRCRKKGEVIHNYNFIEKCQKWGLYCTGCKTHSGWHNSLTGAGYYWDQFLSDLDGHVKIYKKMLKDWRGKHDCHVKAFKLHNKWQANAKRRRYSSHVNEYKHKFKYHINKAKVKGLKFVRQ